jgi:hypothetical protein
MKVKGCGDGVDARPLRLNLAAGRPVRTSVD